MSKILDEFRGDNVNLKASIKALIELGDADALFPNKLGGHARALLASAYHRLDDNRWRSVAEQAEKALKTIRSHAGEIRLLNWNTRSAPIADGIACEIIDEVNPALSAFDSLRKEGTGE